MLALCASHALANAIGTKRLQTHYTLGRKLDDDPYHIATVRSPLTRGLVGGFDDIVDEIVESFKDYIPVTKGAPIKWWQRQQFRLVFVDRLDCCQCVSDSDAHCLSYEQQIFCRPPSVYVSFFFICECILTSVLNMIRSKSRLPFAQRNLYDRRRCQREDSQLLPRYPQTVSVFYLVTCIKLSQILVWWAAI